MQIKLAAAAEPKTVLAVIRGEGEAQSRGFAALDAAAAAQVKGRAGGVRLQERQGQGPGRGRAGRF